MVWNTATIREDKAASLVLRSSIHGSLLWSLEPHVTGDIKYFSINTESDQQLWKQVVVSGNLEEWMVMPATVVPLGVLGACRPDPASAQASGVVLRAAGPSQPVLRHAALTAFRTLNFGRLKDLCLWLEVELPTPRPKS